MNQICVINRVTLDMFLKLSKPQLLRKVVRTAVPGAVCSVLGTCWLRALL